MIKYINKSGVEVEINESPENIKAAEKAGWKVKGKAIPRAPKKDK